MINSHPNTYMHTREVTTIWMPHVRARTGRDTHNGDTYIPYIQIGATAKLAIAKKP